MIVKIFFNLHICWMFLKSFNVIVIVILNVDEILLTFCLKMGSDCQSFVSANLWNTLKSCKCNPNYYFESLMHFS